MLEETDHLKRSWWVYWTWAYMRLYNHQSLTNTLSVPVWQDAERVPLRSAQTLISCEGHGWTARIQGVRMRAMRVKREPVSFHMKCQLFHPDRAEKDSISLSPISLFPLTFSLTFISLTLFQTCWPMSFSQSLLKKSLENTTMMEIKIATAFAQS